MKKYYHYIVLLLFLQTTTAQTLFTDNFDSYTVGNLGTDFSGITPGQGGWYTKRASANSLESPNAASVITEAGRGKVLKFTNSNLNYPTHHVNAYRPNVNTLIDQRTAGNNVIMVEFDLFAGPSNNSEHYTFIFLNTNEDSLQVHKQLFRFKYNHFDGKLNIGRKHSATLHGPLWDSSNAPSVPLNTWVTFKIYLDYNNRKMYLEVPYNNTVYGGDFLKGEIATNLLEKYKPKFFGCGASISFHPMDPRPYQSVYSNIDNIKLSALKSVPPHVLSAESFLATKFNMYPNPATNIVTLTTNEEVFINQIEIYDTAGKLLTTENHNNKTEIQLNVAHLASGTYMLHLTTDKGKAVKKLVKK